MEDLTNAHETRKENKSCTDWRGINKSVFVCKWHDCLWNLKELTKKTPGTNSKVAWYEVNIEKSIAFLNTNNKQEILDIRNTILIYISTPPTEILRYKSNKICARSICGKLQNSDKQKHRRIK